MLRQRIYGLLLVLAAVLLPVLDGGDATASLVLGGLGGWMLGSHTYLLYEPSKPRPVLQKKSASAVTAADAPDPKTGVQADALSITQREGDVK